VVFLFTYWTSFFSSFSIGYLLSSASAGGDNRHLKRRFIDDTIERRFFFISGVVGILRVSNVSPQFQFAFFPTCAMNTKHTHVRNKSIRSMVRKMQRHRR
jgi:hypothetical protein